MKLYFESLLSESVPQVVLSKAINDIKNFSLSMLTEPDDLLSMDRARATFILAQLLGDPSVEQYHLHHINHLKQDNSIENLCLIPDHIHNHLHKLINEFLEECFKDVMYDEDKFTLWTLERENWIPEIINKEFEYLQQQQDVIFLQTVRDRLRGNV